MRGYAAGRSAIEHLARPLAEGRARREGDAAGVKPGSGTPTFAGDEVLEVAGELLEAVLRDDN